MAEIIQFPDNFSSEEFQSAYILANTNPREAFRCIDEIIDKPYGRRILNEALASSAILDQNAFFEFMILYYNKYTEYLDDDILKESIEKALYETSRLNPQAATFFISKFPLIKEFVDPQTLKEVLTVSIVNMINIGLTTLEFACNIFQNFRGEGITKEMIMKCADSSILHDREYIFPQMEEILSNEEHFEKTKESILSIIEDEK